MIRRPPRSTRTDTLFPYTTLFRSEDKPMIALQQAQVGDRDIMSMRPVLLAGDAGDAGAVRARRMLRKLIAQEQSNGEEASDQRSEEHTSELQSLMRNSYAVFCLKKKKSKLQTTRTLHSRTTS